MMAEAWTDLDVGHLMMAYAYGVLHERSYRNRYRNEIKKTLPHIPFDDRMPEIALAGARLLALHALWAEHNVPEDVVALTDNDGNT